MHRPLICGNIFQLLVIITKNFLIFCGNFFQLFCKLYIFTPIWDRNFFQLFCENSIFLLQSGIEIFFSKRRGMNINWVFWKFFSVKKRTLGADLFYGNFFQFVKKYHKILLENAN